MEYNYKKLLELLGTQAKLNVPLALYTTLKVGGPADVLYEARTKEDIVFAYKHAEALQIPITILGGGSNILISDRGIRGLVIKNLSKSISVKGMKGSYVNGQPSGKVFVEADSGVIFNSFVRWCVEEGYKGVEMHLGLPGTVGGAVYMNSKWTNPSGAVGDVVYQVELLTKSGDIIIVPKDYFQFGYDFSILQKNHEIVLSVVFEFKREKKEVLWEIANNSIAYRRTSQPQGVFTPGCTFRNIAQSDAMRIPTPHHTTSAGYLIDAAGLKGYTQGKAQISTIHANFIVNTGGATAQDIRNLITLVQSKVKEKFGVELQEEIVYLGEW